MNLRRLAVAAAGTAMIFSSATGTAAASQSGAATDTPSCSAADEWPALINDYGVATPNPGSPEIWGVYNDPISYPICDLPGAGENNWDELEDLSASGNQCLTWDKSGNYVYDATCGRYPASQSWGFIIQSNGTQIKNYYAGKCLAANGTVQIYTYECAPAGDVAQDWSTSSPA
jgi:hypothetical protein